MSNVETEAPKSAENQGQKPYVFTGEQLLDLNTKEVPMLLEPFIPVGAVVALAGSSDTGKSSWLRQLACAISLGESEFLNFKLNLKHQSAIYVSTEDNAIAISALLHKQKAEGAGNRDYSRLRYIFDSSNLLHKLGEQLQQQPADCVVIDAFADIFDGDMNAANRVRSFIEPYANLARNHDCTVIFLHHTGKRTEELIPSKNNLLGSQGFEGKMRMVAELRIDPNDSTIRHFCVVKGNYIPEDDKHSSFALKFDSATMQFYNTGERVMFELLVKRDIQEDTEKTRSKERARSLQKSGFSIRQIEDAFSKEGLPGKRSAIAGWLNETPASEQDSKDNELPITAHRDDERSDYSVSPPDITGEVDGEENVDG